MNELTARWSSTFVHRDLVLIVLVCASLLIGISHNSGESSFVPHDQHNYFLFRRKGDLTSQGNLTDASIPLAPTSSISGATLDPVSSSSISGLSSSSPSSESSQRSSTSSIASSSLSSQFPSASFSPHSSTEILSSLSQSSSRSAQSSYVN